jgi:hypothetical protein
MYKKHQKIGPKTCQDSTKSGIKILQVRRPGGAMRRTALTWRRRDFPITTYTARKTHSTVAS